MENETTYKHQRYISPSQIMQLFWEEYKHGHDTGFLIRRRKQYNWYPVSPPLPLYQTLTGGRKYYSFTFLLGGGGNFLGGGGDPGSDWGKTKIHMYVCCSLEGLTLQNHLSSGSSESIYPGIILSMWTVGSHSSGISEAYILNIFPLSAFTLL